MSVILFVALGLGLLCGILMLVIFWWMDRHELPSGFFALIPILWAALSLPMASSAFHISSRASGVPGVLYWTLLEVLLLIPGLLLVFGATRFFQGPVDGWLLGSLGGLGVASAEIFARISVTKEVFASLHPLPGPGLLLFFSLEVCVAALLGAGLGWSRVSGRRSVAILCFPAAVLAAIGLKAGSLLLLQNSALELFAALVLLLLICWLGLFCVLLRFESRLVAEELREEVEFRVLPEWCLEIFPFRLRRLRSDWGAQLGERRVLNRMAVYLAFRKHALRRAGGGTNLEGLEIVRLREGLKTRLDAVEYPGRA